MTRSKLECLQGDYSDFYKDVYGFRPRGATSEQWNSEAWLEKQIESLRDDNDQHYAECMKTFAGREELRVEGWCVPKETDPELARMAQWLEDERQREIADLYADVDAQYYGEAA